MRIYIDNAIKGKKIQVASKIMQTDVANKEIIITTHSTQKIPERASMITMSPQKD